MKGLSGQELDTALLEIFADQRERLAQYLRLPKGAQIILCPSGSDAEYLPVALARSLHPSKEIANGITQLNEIGAGSAPASTGKYFSTHAPFLGKHDNENLTGFDGISGTTIPARESNGKLINASEKMDKYCTQQLEDKRFPIVHGVFGGKTGVRDTKMPGSLEAGAKSFGVVDACQGRFSYEEMNSWMNQNSIVLFTTSKFYQVRMC